MERPEDLRSRLETVERRMTELEAEHAECSARIQELRDQNANLQALTAASRILAASPERNNVLAAIADIVVGMIGGRELAIFEIDHIRQSLTLVRAHGLDATSPQLIEAMPILDTVMNSGEALIMGEGDSGIYGGLTAAVPLKLEGCVTGVIAIFRLTERKAELEAVDHSLLEILASQAAISLHSVAYKALRPTVRPPPPTREHADDDAT
jgi:K+-sensing histidine kinase KdpD